MKTTRIISVCNFSYSLLNSKVIVQLICYIRCCDLLYNYYACKILGFSKTRKSIDDKRVFS